MKGVEMLVGNFEFNSGGLGEGGGAGVVKKERLEDFRFPEADISACVVNVERRGKREGKSAKVNVPPEVRSASK